MRKLSALVAALFVFMSSYAQPETAVAPRTTIPKAGDHFMLQIGHNIWSGAPDSITNRMKGFNRSANVYLMLNRPFRSNDKLSIGLGLGIGTSNMYFEKTNIDIAGTTPKLAFINADSTNRFKKYKLSTAYLEVPLELRFSSRPDNPNKSIKAAIGLKAGTLLNAKTKGKTLQNSADVTINNNLVQKIASKSYFTTTQIAATARVGYGIFSLYGTYGLTPVFKDGVTADIKQVQIGLTISGL